MSVLTLIKPVSNRVHHSEYLRAEDHSGDEGKPTTEPEKTTPPEEK